MHLILHIGTEKTGTTVLQDWLYANRPVLSEHGVYLSKQIGVKNNRDLVSFFQKGLDDWARARRISNDEEKQAYFTGFKERFAAEVVSASATHDVMIITSEHFHSRLQSREEITELRDFLTGLFKSVRVCCYFREQADMALSRYSTWLKGDQVIHVDDFLNYVTPGTYYYNYKLIADSWSGAFGRDNCEFRIYDRSRLRGGDIRTDFISCVPKTIDPQSLDMNVKIRRNEKLSDVEAVFFRLINDRIPFWNEASRSVDSHNRFLKKLILKVKKPSSLLGIDHRIQEIRSRFTEENQQFFATYFNGQESFNYPAASHSPPTDIVDTIDNYVGPLVSQLSELQTENRRLRSENQRLLWSKSYYSSWPSRMALLTESGAPRAWFRLAFLNKNGRPRSFAKRLFYRDNGSTKRIFRYVFP